MKKNNTEANATFLTHLRRKTHNTKHIYNKKCAKTKNVSATVQ